MLLDDDLELLTEEQCARLLASKSIGRVGVTLGGLPVILPVSYAYRDGAIYFRTAEGTKLHAATRGTVIAFEVDDAEPAKGAGWSVLIVGRASVVSDGPPIDVWPHDALSSWVGHRSPHVVRIDPEIVTGRRISAP
jgi:nitroimidazol reductase NimA-like FMN-containing flavoprotein (pyridoxamine 5'-phosphate oxidase superfamily)